MSLRSWNKPLFLLVTSAVFSWGWLDGSRKQNPVHCDSTSTASPPKHLLLHHHNHHIAEKSPLQAILPIHANKTSTDETLLEWSENRQQQITDLPIINLTELLAFLGLLGIQEISLSDIARIQNTKEGFLLKLPKLRHKDIPRVLYTPQDILSMVQELKTPKVILRSYKPSAPNPIHSVKPIFETNVKRAIQLEILASFYESIALATDEELHGLVHHFLGDLDTERHTIVFHKLQDSKSLCKMYFNLRDYLRKKTGENDSNNDDEEEDEEDEEQ